MNFLLNFVQLLSVLLHSDDLLQGKILCIQVVILSSSNQMQVIWLQTKITSITFHFVLSAIDFDNIRLCNYFPHLGSATTSR